MVGSHTGRDFREDLLSVDHQVLGHVEDEGHGALEGRQHRFQLLHVSGGARLAGSDGRRDDFECGGEVVQAGLHRGEGCLQDFLVGAVNVHADRLCVSDAVLDVGQAQVRSDPSQQAANDFEGVADTEVGRLADDERSESLAHGVAEGFVVLLVVGQDSLVDLSEDLLSVDDQVVADVEDEGNGVLEGRERSLDLGDVSGVGRLAGLDGRGELLQRVRQVCQARLHGVERSLQEFFVGVVDV